MASQYNGARATKMVDGVEYKVKFKMTYQTVSETEAINMAKTNKDIKVNFFRVSDAKRSSFMQDAEVTQDF